jgi:hypothetical protein
MGLAQAGASSEEETFQRTTWRDFAEEGRPARAPSPPVKRPVSTLAAGRDLVEGRVLNRRVVSEPVKRFEFIELESGLPSGEEPGLKQFLEDPSLSGTATEEEIAFLRKLSFKNRRPTPLYYYRELQNLRDPLHSTNCTCRGRGFILVLDCASPSYARKPAI